VVFSFFKKDKPSKAPEPQRAEKRPPRGQEGPPTLGPTDAGPKTLLRNGMEVVEAGANVSAAVEEAAVLYASGHTGQAITSLTHSLLENPESQATEPWLLLFDLYRIVGHQADFEELAMEYSVRFERSPPAWTGAGVGASDPGYDARAGNAYVLPARMEADQDFSELRSRAKSGAPRLEMGKVEYMAPAAALHLHEALDYLRKRGVKIRPSGSDYFTAVVGEARQTHPSEPGYWLLGLDMLQLDGNQEEFENMAVDYAVHFEVSPPSWEEMIATDDIDADDEEEQEVPSAEPESSDTFSLSGVIDASAQSQLQELKDFADGRGTVEIDMSGVLRLDFSTVGLFMNCMIEIGQGGRRILVRDALEPVNALMRVMGIDQLVTLIGKTK
jgi:anti-anti-sigma regulatory factor